MADLPELTVDGADLPAALAPGVPLVLTFEASNRIVPRRYEVTAVGPPDAVVAVRDLTGALLASGLTRADCRLEAGFYRAEVSSPTGGPCRVAVRASIY